jgi:hypothetical protein
MSVLFSKTDLLDKFMSQNNVVDVTTSTLTVTSAYKDKILVANRAAGVVFTLPAATAATAGDTYTFFVGTTITSNAFTVTALTGDLLYGNIIMKDNDNATAGDISFAANTSDDILLSSNGSTTGGLAGSYVIFTCLTTDKWLVTGKCFGTGTIATPFA